jgi:hypothetical protein
MSAITPEERTLLKKVHRQRWDIDEGDMSIYRDIDGELTCKLATDFEGPEKIARELAQVWQSAFPIVVRLENALKSAEVEVARLRAILEQQERLRSVMKEARNQMDAARKAVGTGEVKA